MQLAELVDEWAFNKGIYEAADMDAQIEKLLEEAGEVKEAHSLGLYNPVLDEIGDVLVVAIILANMYASSPEECLNKAWRKISKRTGKMVDGQFVKDAY